MVISYDEVLSIDADLRGKCLSQAASPKKECIAGAVVCWQRPIPGAAVRGVLLLLHGGERRAIKACPFHGQAAHQRGLPEHEALAQTALYRGWFTVSIACGGGPHRLWDPPRDGPRIARVLSILRTRENLETSPLAALGVYGGAKMALLLKQWVPELSAVVAQLGSTPVPIECVKFPPPPSLFVHMPLREPETGASVRETIAELRQIGVRASALPCGPHPISSSFFADRIGCIDADTALDMALALHELGFTDSHGFLIDDPRASEWRSALRRHAESIGDSLIEGDSPIAQEMNMAWASHEVTAEWAEESMEWCETKGATEYFWTALEAGQLVVAPWRNLSLRRARVVGSLLPVHAEILSLPSVSSESALLVAYGEDAKAQLALVKARSLMPWKNYAEAVVGADMLDRNRTALDHDLEVHLWRGEMSMEGLFSQLFWAIGFLEAASDTNAGERRFLIDWTSPHVAASGEGPPNPWNALFEQPWRPRPHNQDSDARSALHHLCPYGTQAALFKERWAPWREESPGEMAFVVNKAEAAGKFHATVAFGPPYFSKFGNFVLAQPYDGSRGGRLTKSMVTRGRNTFRKWIRVRQSVLDDVQDFFNSRMACFAVAWLAVHVRLTDKLDANGGSVIAMARAIELFARHLGCNGVFICADDANAKIALADTLRHLNFAVVLYPAVLSSRGLPAHKDPFVDRFQNSRDMLVECLLMAQCKALLGSWSNVSAAVAWFASDGFEQFLFADVAPSERFDPAD